MPNQSYMIPLDDDNRIFDASTFAITVQRLVDCSAGPDFPANAREFPDLVGHGYKFSEAYGGLLWKIEQRHQAALAAGLPFPDPLLD